ncbi:MAG: Primase 2 [Acidobacteria bacterium]|nr:Primase 2 [Acidobacteriota bacterium]
MRAALANDLERSSGVLVLHRGDSTAEDAEQATLSAMLMDREAIAAVREILRAADFLFAEHRAVFTAISRLADEGVVVDPLTLADDLARHGELVVAGGRDFIGFLIDAVPMATNVRDHAGIVLRESKTRATVELLEESVVRLRRGDEDAAHVAQRLRPALDALAFDRCSVLAFVDDVEIAQLPKMSFVIDGLIPAGGLTTLYGAPESGKSLFALQAAFAVASGHPFFGNGVERGDVVYVAGEGVSGISARVEALRGRYGYPGRQGVQFLSQPINLLKAEEVTQLIESIRALGLAPKLIVFDTLSRCLLGGDENSAQDMGAVLSSCERLAREFGAAVLLIHHTGKAGDTERGSSALRAGSDAMVFAKRDGDLLTFSIDKLKDGSRGAPLRLCIESASPSVVLAVAGSASCPASRSSVAKERRALSALGSDFMADGATATQWQIVTDIPERDFYRIRTRLVTDGYVTSPGAKRGGKYTLTEKGRLEFAASCKITAQ